MADLGDKLRAAREKKGLTIGEVAFETRIRRKIVEALEAGDYHELPPAPFDRGLLKNFALFLGLDPDFVLDEYAIELGLKAAPPPPPEVAPPPAIERPTSLPSETQPIFVTPLEATRRPPPDYLEPYDSARDLLRPERSTSTVSRQTDSAAAASASNGTAIASTFSGSQSPREAPPFFANGAEPVFQVAPEVSPDPAPAPERPIWTQRISATKLPEAVAAIAVVVAILGLAAFGYSRFFQSENNTSQPGLGVSEKSQTATPQQTIVRLPSAVPTFEATLSGGIATSPGATKSAKASPVKPSSSVPAGAQMTIQISAGELPVWAWVVVDNVEVFKGNIQNDTKTWSAHERLYFQAKDLPNGSVAFNGKAVLPRVFAERKMIERAWQMNSAGAPVGVEPQPFLPTPVPTPTVTPTRAPTLAATPTNAPTLTTPPAPIVTPTTSETPSAGLAPSFPSALASGEIVNARLDTPGSVC